MAVLTLLSHWWQLVTASCSCTAGASQTAGLPDVTHQPPAWTFGMPCELAGAELPLTYVTGWPWVAAFAGTE